jgi:hypothetical protein
MNQHHIFYAGLIQFLVEQPYQSLVLLDGNHLLHASGQVNRKRSLSRPDFQNSIKGLKPGSVDNFSDDALINQKMLTQGLAGPKP